MSVFSSDKAPYVLALLLSVLGWQFSRINEEIVSTQSLTFDVKTRTIEDQLFHVVTVENISQRDSIKGARFTLSCPVRKACFVGHDPNGGDEDFDRIPSNEYVRDVPPADLSLTPIVANGAITVDATMPPGAVLEFGLVALEAGEAPIFRYRSLDSDSGKYTEDQGVLALDKNSMRGMAIDNYLPVLIISFFLIGGSLLLILTFALFKRAVEIISSLRIMLSLGGINNG